MTNELRFDNINFMETTQAIFDYSLRENPMGEACKDALRLDFDRRLKLEFHGTKITGDGDVNLDDLHAMAAAWLNVGTNAADLNYD